MEDSGADGKENMKYRIKTVGEKKENQRAGRGVACRPTFNELPGGRPRASRRALWRASCALNPAGFVRSSVVLTCVYGTIDLNKL